VVAAGSCGAQQPPGSAAWAVAGQIAKINGARAVGIAGGERKCALLTAELGFDTAADYRSSR
jgi:NADPH-dependent curcumin reductase CurA